jgi:type VI secretion system VgrG family protein
MEGVEVLNRPYRFEFELVSKKADIDSAAILQATATMGIKQGIVAKGGKNKLVTLTRKGMIASFEQIGKQNEWTTYKAVLVPPLWRLSLYYESGSGHSISLKSLVTAKIKRAWIDEDLFKFKDGMRNIEAWEYVAQHEESDLDFIHRWLEHEGIFYWFEQVDGGVKTFFGDSQAHFPASTQTLSYTGALPQPDDGGGGSTFDWFDTGKITEFSKIHNRVPGKVILRDYNCWMDPPTHLEVEADVFEKGQGVGLGTRYETNNHYRTEREGKALAQIRAQEIRASEILFKGHSTARTFAPGTVFTMADHYRSDFNIDYLLTEVRHKASQDVALATNAVFQSTYDNEFTAIRYASDLTFRPPRTTPWPRVSGLTTAVVEGPDGEDSLNLDAEGNYTVRLSSDRTTPANVDGSKPVRMAQPSAGLTAKMHIPLHVGTEVVMGHENGHPDRPLILGAVPNRKNESIVNDRHPADSVIRSARHSLMGVRDLYSMIRMSDSESSSALLLKSGRNAQISMSNLLYTPLDLFSSQGGIHSTSAGLSHSVTAGLMSSIRAGKSIGWLVGIPALQIPLQNIMSETTKQIADRIQDHRGQGDTEEKVLDGVSIVWTLINLAVPILVNTVILKKVLGNQLEAMKKDLKGKYKETRELFDKAFWPVERTKFQAFLVGIRDKLVSLPLINLIKKLKQYQPPPDPGFSVQSAKGMTTVDATGGKDFHFATDLGWIRFWCGDEFNIFTRKHFKALFEETGFLGNRFGQIHIHDKGNITARAGKTKMYLSEKYARFTLPSNKEGAIMGNCLHLDGDKALVVAPVVDLHARTAGLSADEPKVLINDKGVNIQTGKSSHKITIQTKDLSIKIDGEQISLLGKTGNGGITIRKDGDVTIASKGEIVLKAPDVKVECCTNMDVSGNLKVGGKLDHPSVSGEPMPPPVTMPVMPPSSSDTIEDTSPGDTVDEGNEEEESQFKRTLRLWEERSQGQAK